MLFAKGADLLQKVVQAWRGLLIIVLLPDVLHTHIDLGPQLIDVLLGARVAALHLIKSHGSSCERLLPYLCHCLHLLLRACDEVTPLFLLYRAAQDSDVRVLVLA